MDTPRHDAIVIGSGISGGWAAKELCELGLKTLVLERGRDVRHLRDYPTMNTARWAFPLRGDNSRQWNEQNPLISRAGGYVAFGGASREAPVDGDPGHAIGADFKRRASRPGRWTTYLYMQGETLPKRSNHVRLSADRRDRWGIPQLVVSVGYDDNDDRMVADFLREGRAMLEAAGVTNITEVDNHQPPGLDIHEMGGVRMGSDPATSLLNADNQLHACRNVYVTDGACMTSTGSQSPSILYMALTARAAHHAAAQLARHGVIP